ncbi:MAG TPA: TolC family protein [Gammaproteobacteria bacterium]|nr:TolC family protein [Gammaproteobacteria bacterium]
MRVSLLLLIIMVLAGCATFHNQPISPGNTLAAFDARRLDSAETRHAVEASLRQRVAPWPPQRWTLALLTPVALHYSAVLAAAEAHARTVNAGIQIAGEYPNPQFSFAPGYNTSSPAGESPWIFDYGLSFPIPTAGRRGAAIRQARALSTAADFDMASSAWQVRNRLRSRLLDLYAAGQQVALLRQQSADQREILSLLQARYASGEISAPAWLEARSAYNAVQYALASAKTRETIARDALAAALGMPATALQGVHFAFNEFTRPLDVAPQAAVQRNALLNRADILAVLARYAASQYALQREIARQYPSLQIGPGFQWDQGQDKWSLGISISLPIFNHNQGAVAAAEARRREAAAQFEVVQNQVIAQVTQAMAAYRGARDSLSLAMQATDSAEQAAQAATAQFKAGESDALALFFARQTALRSELAQLHALISAQTALTRLENALQQPLKNGTHAPRVTLPKEHS